MKTKTYIFLRALLCAAAAIFAVLCGAFALAPSTSADAASYLPYSMEIERFDATYDVHSDRTIDIEERVTIEYTGSRSTGFYRDLPVNAGDRVYGVSVSELSRNGANEVDVDYSVSLDDDLLTLDIGDNTIKTDEVHTYVIRYTFAVTSPADDNALFLNVVGFGSEAPIHAAEVTINLPEGFERADLYVGDTDRPSNELMNLSGSTIKIELTSLGSFRGATVDLFFEEGALSTRFDFVPYVMVIVACVVLAALAAVKFLVFPKRPLTPVVHFDPPRGLDPAEMSKLIDNKVSSEDVTSLIFYWASKGYLKINFEDEDDAELIRIFKTLPDGAPAHQRAMYDSLFGSRDMVKISALEGRFYGVIESVKKSIDAKYRGMYTGRSKLAAAGFALAGGLLMALTPVIVALTAINSTLLYAPAFIAVIPAFVIFALAQLVMFNVHKLKSSTKWLYIAGIAALAGIFTALYAMLIPSAIIELAPKILVCIVAYIISGVAVTLISPSEEYISLLNDILGFKNFILYTEKDKIEVMLKDDPEFYYKILPYAQVLGVSDIWEDKFKDLTVAPPDWAVDPAGTLVSFAIINRALRTSSAAFASRMAVRPSSPSSRSYSGGGRHGGSFGGRGGGGHGGGGFRGR